MYRHVRVEKQIKVVRRLPLQATDCCWNCTHTASPAEGATCQQSGGQLEEEERKAEKGKKRQRRRRDTKRGGGKEGKEEVKSIKGKELIH